MHVKVLVFASAAWQHAVHSLAIDPTTHRVYAPEQDENGRAVARMVVYDAINH